MNEDLKNLFFKRFDAMMELLSNADSTSSRENRLLKTAEFDDSNEIEYNQSIQNLKIRGKYYEHQVEMLSDFDILTIVSIPEEEQKMLFKLFDEYKNRIDSKKEIFNKIANVFEDDDIKNFDSFVEFVMKNSSNVNTYYDMIKEDRDFKKSLFYCYMIKYTELIYEGVVKPYKFSEVLKKLSKASETVEIQTKPIVQNEIKKFKEEIPELRRDDYSKQKIRERIRGGLEEKPQTDFIGLILQSFKMSHFNI